MPLLWIAIALARPPTETSRLDTSVLCDAAPPGAVVVELVRDGARYGAWWMDPARCGELGWVALGDVATLDADAARYRALLANDALEVRHRPVGRALTSALFTPLEEEIGERERWLLLVPDGELALLPFSALPHGDGYLVEHTAVGLLDGTRDLTGEARPWLPTVMRWGRGEAFGALLVGGVRFGEPGEAACHPGVMPPLPDTLREVRRVRLALRPKVPRWSVELLSGEQATVANIEALASSRRFVHLATHGYALSCEDELRGAGLLLAGEGEDALLTAARLGRLDLSGTELLVLSACSSAVGARLDAEGMLGLRHAALEAGAQTVIAALWAVDDAATRSMMVRLYMGLLGRRPSQAADALRDAQLAVLRRNRRRFGDARPHQWAAFMAAGRWW